MPYRFHHLRIEAGGFITGILFHPAIPGLAYLRTDIGGAYRWDGRAGRWTSLSEWLPASESNLIGVESMAIDPRHPNDLYLAAGTYTQPGVPDGALLRSHDRGAHFQVIPLPFQLGGNEPGRFAGERLAVDPTRPGVLYLGTRNDGLWRSADSGSTWSRLAGFPGQSTNGVGVVFVVFGPQGTAGAPAGQRPVYAGVSTLAGPTLLVSPDGLTWQPVPGAPRGMLPYHAAFSPEGTLYLTYGSAPGPNDVSVGAVWRRSPSLHWQQITPEPSTGNARGFGYAGLALDRQHPGTVLVSTLDRWQPGDTLWASRDGGDHWISLAAKAERSASASPYLVHFGKLPFGHWIGAIAIDPFNSNHALYGTGETLWSTGDLANAWNGKPTHWTVGADGIEETAVIDLLAPHTGAPLFAGLGDIGCFRADTVVAGAEAVALQPPALSNCDRIAVASGAQANLAMVGRVWSGTSHGGYSTDGGRHWTPFAAEPEGAQAGGSVAFTTEGKQIFWTTNTGIYSSADRGAHWAQMAACGTGHHRPELVADPRVPQRVYLLPAEGGSLVELDLPAKPGAMPAGTAAGGCTLAGDVAAHPLVASLAPGTRVIADPQGARLWLYGKAGLRTLDLGTRALRVVTGQAAVSAFAVGAPMGTGAPETLFFAGQLAGKDGIYRSVDLGHSWQHIDDAQHQYGFITTMAADRNVSGRVFLGTNGLGVVVAEPATGMRP